MCLTSFYIEHSVLLVLFIVIGSFSAVIV